MWGMCHLHMPFCSQMLHVQTRKRAGVRRQAVMAQVTWLACTRTIGACRAVRTKTGCHQKVSIHTPTEHRFRVFPQPVALMFFDVQESACFPWPLLCLARSVYLLSWLDCVLHFSGVYSEGSDGLQLRFSCDLLHGAMDLLADCLPSVPWWWGGKWGFSDVQIVAIQWLVGRSRAVNQRFT